MRVLNKLFFDRNIQRNLQLNKRKMTYSADSISIDISNRVIKNFHVKWNKGYYMSESETTFMNPVRT
jgi:hypothetical protein